MFEIDNSGFADLLNKHLDISPMNVAFTCYQAFTDNLPLQGNPVTAE